MARVKLFSEGLFRELPALVYWCLAFSFFRIAFIAAYRGRLVENIQEVPWALARGWLLSLETASFICLVGAALVALRHAGLLARAARLRLFWHEAALALSAFLFTVRLPYYGYFGAAFSMHLFGGGEGDAAANFFTLAEDYRLGARLAFWAVLAAALIFGFRRMDSYVGQKAIKGRLAAAFLALAVLPCLPALFGAGIFSSRLLNEAVLDDAHALLRVWRIREEFRRECSADVTEEELRRKIVAAGGAEDAADIDSAFSVKAGQPLLSSSPSRVVLIISESMGSWALKPGFRELGIAENLASWQDSADCASVETMLAAGYGTIHAVNAALTGLPYTGLLENGRENGKLRHEAGVGRIMGRLGYKTVFFYGGRGTWQNLGSFALAQGFDEFFGAQDLEAAAGNAWGVEDEELFSKAAEYMDKNARERKLFMVLLTTSNHPPYSVDVDRRGFPRERIAGLLPESLGRDKHSLDALGHIWYADQAMGSFVHAVRKRYPDTLFAVTGDHSERFDFAREMDREILSPVPCLFFGQGVSRSWLGEGSSGTHMQLAASFAKLLAPEGFAYTAYLPSVFDSDAFAFNCEHYAASGRIRPLSENPDAQVRAQALRGVAAWRILKGNEF